MENNMSKSLSDLLHYHKTGTDYISRALAIDETLNQDIKTEAVHLYELGIEEFLVGLEINLHNELDENKERGLRIQDKMRTNLQMALDRIDDLNHKSPRIDSIKKRFERQQSQQKSLDDNSNELIGKVANRLQNVLNNPTPSSSHFSKNTSKDKKLNSVGSRVSSAGYAPRPSSGTVTKKTTNPARNSTYFGSASGHNNGASGHSSTGQQIERVPVSKKLKIPNVDEKLISVILDEIVDQGQNVKFSDIAGQGKAKQALNELVILPALNPDV